MSSIIEKWYRRVKPYFFTYKKGFFVMPYFNNTPQLMWKAIQQMPFVRFSTLLNLSESNTPFLHAKMYYHELEKDLVLFYNEINYKKNVSFEHYRKEDIPLEYYCLTGFLSDSSGNNLKTIVNDIHFNGQLWILHKPDAILKDYHFKNSQTKTIILYFTKAWLDSYFMNYPLGNDRLKHFINSNKSTIGLSFNNTVQGEYLLNKAAALMKQELSHERTNNLNNYTIEVMEFFKTQCINKIKKSDSETIDHAVLLKLMDVERILTANVHLNFPGISFIAKQTGLSETRLKNNFKEIYGLSVFQYFRKLQMEYARDLILNSDESIKEIAAKIGYENASKFSSAFKNHLGILPSEIK